MNRQQPLQCMPLQPFTHRAVDVVPDTLLPVSGPSTHRVVGVRGGAADDGGEEITPAFAHSSALSPAEASRVGGTTSQTSRQAVGEFVDDDAGFQVTITEGSGGVPDVHAHATALTIRGLETSNTGKRLVQDGLQERRHTVAKLALL